MGTRRRKKKRLLPDEKLAGEETHTAFLLFFFFISKKTSKLSFKNAACRMMGRRLRACVSVRANVNACTCLWVGRANEGLDDRAFINLVWMAPK